MERRCTCVGLVSGLRSRIHTEGVRR
jgi:hypothetical protein